MTSAVLLDAGRSAIVPDDPGLPETPVGLTEDLIRAMLSRTRLRPAELTDLFLADPRCLSTGCSAGEAGWVFEPPPFGLSTTVCASSSTAVQQAIRTIERQPEVVAVVAAIDFGAVPAGPGESAAELLRHQRAARMVAARWDVAPDELGRWARWSAKRAAECSAAGDFAAEILCTSRGYLADRFPDPAPGDAFSGGSGRGAAAVLDDGPAVPACPSRGASAMILASEANAVELGLRPRAWLRATGTVRGHTCCGVAPPAGAVDELLAPCGLDVHELDQLEVPEKFAVTPIAWIKETGISPYLVNPRGGELAFGHLPRSGHLRSLVTMLNSLEATGGRAGAVVAAERDATTGVVVLRD
ncbi:acetyl-CoA acetyltransferase [Amycolatopsis deserti]|uniref:Acetyl-CoA acetyltransferase n=1 Tax=Amycolatopsis deserti TaxID=185696 RepID=A0ABQ3IEV0_9PSEU|nr:hypothetical protein [Amycolatopsis deserti]GHE79467.1 acetyl-CoA acetyltransferase [Amycolatopsis deserti]